MVGLWSFIGLYKSIEVYNLILANRNNIEVLYLFQVHDICIKGNVDKTKKLNNNQIEARL